MFVLGKNILFSLLCVLEVVEWTELEDSMVGVGEYGDKKQNKEWEGMDVD